MMTTIRMMIMIVVVVVLVVTTMTMAAATATTTIRGKLKMLSALFLYTVCLVSHLQLYLLQGKMCQISLTSSHFTVSVKQDHLETTQHKNHVNWTYTTSIYGWTLKTIFKTILRVTVSQWNSKYDTIQLICDNKNHFSLLLLTLPSRADPSCLSMLPSRGV